MKNIAVIGAGVNGLSSAVQILEYFPRDQVQVTLISEKVSPDTTGDVSAGLWGPYLIGDTPEQKIEKWSKVAHDYLHELWLKGMGEEAGITMIPCYRLVSDVEGQIPSWKNVVFGFRVLEDKELKKLSKEHKRPYKSGCHFVTFCCEPTKFLPYLMRRFTQAGGKFEMRKVNDINELKGYDLIVNCTGLGSQKMTNDAHLKPVRGQVAKVKAPWIYEVFLHEDDVGNYIIPNTNNVVLGGTHQVGDYNLKVSMADSAFIMNGCKKIFPSLENAEIIKEVVGLRPGRTEVRLEIERRSGGVCPIIHNVGHGGCGVTLCWGCGRDVLEKTIEVINEKSAKL